MRIKVDLMYASLLLSMRLCTFEFEGLVGSCICAIILALAGGVDAEARLGSARSLSSSLLNAILRPCFVRVF